ncbi:MAG TPA: TonB-dependent receptor [Vicinamibacterales bacterium]|nr:TonB-dependent receptor [Vicinamibacterales bacterium]
MRTLLSTSFFFILYLLFAGAVEAHAARLHGRVVDPDGRPVANAEVIVSGPTAAPLRARTDRDGRFTFPVIESGKYSIVATAPGLVSDARVLDFSTDATVDIPLRITAVSETLVVSAAQIDQPLSRTPDSVTVIDGREVEAKQQFTLGAALRSVPGLTLQQNGGPGTVTSLFTRGGESDFTLVLIDGVRANAFGGGLDLSQVPLHDVERIEVLRGSQSALYGSDAIAGVVQIITRSGGPPSAQAQIETGSRDMRRAAAATTGEISSFRWQLGANYFEDAGFTGTAANGQTVSNDDAQETQVTGSTGWRHAASGADLQGSVLYVDSDRGSPGPFGSDPARRFAGVNRVSRSVTDRIGGGVRWVQPWFGAGSRVRQRVNFDTADYDLAFTSATSTSLSNTSRKHARVQTDVAASSAVGFSGGLEWLGESGRSTFITAGAAGQVPVERAVLGIFGEGRWSPGARATVTAGARAERITRDALRGDPLAFQPRPDFPAETITSVNPKLAASFAVRETTRLRGSFGTGIRPPDAFEIAFTDNSGLKPERSRSGELGVTQTIASGAVQIDGTAFFNRYKDLIISVGRSFSGVSRWRTDNISNARARGAELSAAWRLDTRVSVRGNYTFLDSEILAVSGSSSAQTPYAVGDALLRRPRHSGSLDASWTHVRGLAFAQLQVRGEALDAEPAFGPTGGLYANPGHTVMNVGGSYRPIKAIEIFARALNLFDRDYEEVMGYPAPGRTAYVGARFAVGR